MKTQGLSALEWLITHSWSIIIVLTVGAALYYLGVFEASASPKMLGFQSSALRPIPGQVQMYSDGIMVVTVINTRPHSVQLDWIEVAPIADKDDKIRTYVNDQLAQGAIGVYYINASNINGNSQSFIMIIPTSNAETITVDAHLTIQQTYSLAGKTYTLTSEGELRNIPVSPQASQIQDCTRHRNCPCDTDADCPFSCQVCWDYGTGKMCDNLIGCPGGICGEIGVCMPAVSCASSDECPPGSECVKLPGEPFGFCTDYVIF